MTSYGVSQIEINILKPKIRDHFKRYSDAIAKHHKLKIVIVQA